MNKTAALAVATLFATLAPLANAQYDRYGNYDRNGNFDRNGNYVRDYDRRDHDRREFRGDDDRGYRRGDVARVIDTRPVYDVAASRQECWNPHANHFEEVREQNKTRIGKGAAIGAVAGGVIGHQFGDSGTAQTAAGALIGGIVGHQIERRNDRDEQNDLDYTRCRAVAGSESANIAAYDVRYQYRGQEYVARMDHDPGRTLLVGRDVRDDGRPY